MAITIRDIANIGSPPADPTCLLPGKLYVPDPELFPQPWDCVVGTQAGHFTTHGDLRGLDRPFRDLANQGFLCLAFYVRLLDPIPTQTTTGKYAQQTDDFKIGVEFMRSDPGGFGYEVTGFVAALGGSGSAHHALYSALDGVVGVDRADAAICMSPATDFSDREDDVSDAFIAKVEAYGDSTDLATLLARSPISLSLDDVQPILHYNGDSEAMPLSQLTRFRDGAISDIVTYSSRINTGSLGQVHSFAMWPQISAEAIAWLFQWTGGTPTPPPPVPPPSPVQSAIGREGSFRRAFNRVILKLGKDPFKPLPYELTRAVVEHINQRVSVICPIWRWPEWEVTEERAFRQVWNATRQFFLVNSSNRADEVFYIPEMKYYRVTGTANPPIGTLPTNTTYWTEITPLDTFIEYNQTCKRPIGMVLGVYSQNPRVPTGSMNGKRQFMPSEKGIDVHASTPTVFITYKKPIPRYTMTPLRSGFRFLKGEVVFDPETGECFQAVSDNNGDAVTDTTSWRIQPLPQAWENYVVEGAFADALCELDPSNENIATAVMLSQKAELRANDLLQVAVDSLTIQGQRLVSNWCKPVCGCWCESIPFTGGDVTTLTDECEDEGFTPGVIIPPTDTATVRREYHDEIVAILTADGIPSLEGLATADIYLAGSLVEIVIGEDTQTTMTFKLYEGPADDEDTGQVTPEDYDPDTNDVHWAKVS